MSAYTPGPWWQSGAQVFESRDHDFTIADASGPQREANARLIAAAPEMLAALKLLLPLLRLMPPLNAGPGMDAEECARAVIAKAEGESPGRSDAENAAEADANGRLFAAAPEMLGALRFFAEAQDCYCDPIQWTNGICCHERARAAIAKAEGKP